MAVTHHLLPASHSSGMRFADQTSGIRASTPIRKFRVEIAVLQELPRDSFLSADFATRFNFYHIL
jgi:hypothetical protein